MPFVSVSDLVGCPFKIHGRTKEEGFDCYGLAIEVYRRAGKTIPDVFYNSLDNREEIKSKIIELSNAVKLQNPEYLCIILIERAGKLHVGVYLKDGMFIHSIIGLGVVIEPLYRYRRTVKGYYKFTN